MLLSDNNSNWVLAGVIVLHMHMFATLQCFGKQLEVKLMFWAS